MTVYGVPAARENSNGLSEKGNKEGTTLEGGTKMETKERKKPSKPIKRVEVITIHEGKPEVETEDDLRLKALFARVDELITQNTSVIEDFRQLRTQLEDFLQLNIKMKDSAQLRPLFED